MNINDPIRVEVFQEHMDPLSIQIADFVSALRLHIERLKEMNSRWEPRPAPPTTRSNDARSNHRPR